MVFISNLLFVYSIAVVFKKALPARLVRFFRGNQGDDRGKIVLKMAFPESRRYWKKMRAPGICALKQMSLLPLNQGLYCFNPFGQDKRIVLEGKRPAIP